MTMARTLLPTNFMRSREHEENADVQKTAEKFRERFDGDNATVEGRKSEATSLVNEYYDLVTDFYEFGWGQSFHFAPRFAGETFFESLARHEYFLAARGQFKASDHIIDIGCGVGGPLRNMARFTGANIVGINNNEYQIGRGRKYDSRFGLSHLCSYVRSDFCNMPFKADEKFDGAYAIEATCHATDKVKCYSEIFRVLKPGACFVGYEWIVTDKYDHSNELHRKVRHGIELGDALPTLETAAQVVKALEDSGFIVELHFDLCEKYESGPAKTITWYNPLEGSYTPMGFKATPLGRMCTSTMVAVLEKVGLAPKGSRHTAAILEEAAVNLVLGGKLGIFTPSFFFKARKPLEGEVRK